MRKKMMLAVLVGLMTCLNNHIFAEEQDTRQAELDKINQRLSHLESQADKNEKTSQRGNDKVKISGVAYIQAEGAKSDDEAYGDHLSKASADITIKAPLPSNWEFEMMQRTTQPFSNAGDLNSTNTETLAVRGNLFGGKATIGRMYYWANQWDVIGDTWITGGKFDFGDKVKTSLTMGRLRKSYPLWSDAFNQSTDSPLYRALDINTDVNSKLHLDATVHEVRDNGTEHVYEASANYQLTPDVSVVYNLYKSSLPDTGTGNKGYMTKLTYGQLKINKAHSSEKYVVYRKLPKYAQLDTGSPWLLDKKTLRLGYNYMIDQNLALISFYDFRTSLATDKKEQGFRLRLQAWF